MILVYGGYLKNASPAVRVYAQRYLGRREPFDMIFNWPPVKLSKQTVEEHEIAIVLQIFEEDHIWDNAKGRH
jgi:hypothetical protein